LGKEADMASVEIEKTDMSEQLPDWFKPIPGFKFRDEDGDPCIVIGWGGWRDVEPSAGGVKLVFKSCGLLYANLYKGEWHIREVKPSDMSKIMPGWVQVTIDRLSGWQ